MIRDDGTKCLKYLHYFHISADSKVFEKIKKGDRSTWWYLMILIDLGEDSLAEVKQEQESFDRRTNSTAIYHGK